MLKKLLLILTLSTLLFGQAQAQSSSYLSCPDFVFTRDLKTGSKGDDVYVMQKILNLDGRTVVSTSGLGAPGNETFQFGIKTRESLKRFQALFIEYIQVADGKFNAKTRTVMNAVCRGPFFTGDTSCGVFGDNKNCKATTTVATTTTVVNTNPLSVTLYGPAEVENVNDFFRVLLVANKPIKTPSLSGLIVYNATTQDFRKISPTSFTFAVYPNQDAKRQITLQVEADAITDLQGKINEIASNELIIKIKNSGTGAGTTTAQTGFPDLDALLAQAGLPSVASTTLAGYSGTCPTGYTVISPNFAGTSIAAGAIAGKDGTLCKPDAGTNTNTGEEKKDDNKIMDMLMKLLPELLKMAKDGGGNGAGQGTCVCPGPLQGQPTIGLSSYGGTSVPGRYLETLNPGSGFWTGKTLPSPGMTCGQMVVKGKCVNPTSDSTGMPLTGMIPPPGIFNWGSGI